MLKCKQATELASHQLDRKLSLMQRINLRIHLLICNRCARFAQQIRLFGAAGHKLNQHLENHGDKHLSAEAQAKIKQQLDKAIDTHKE